MSMVEVDRAQVLRFRLSRHHLVDRLPEGALAEAAAACGIQETPRGTALVALHARVEGVTAAGVDGALHDDKHLLLFWAMRGAPYVVPTDDASVFAAGSLPVGEDSWRTFFGGWATSLADADAGASLPSLVDEAAEVATAVLDGEPLPVDDLRHAIADRMPVLQGLRRPSGAHADLPEPLYRALGPRQVACIADRRRMTDALVARIDRWLGRPLAEPHHAPDLDAARGELLRRYLGCYGPGTAQGFAEWTSRSVADAQTVFDALASELVQVTVGRSTGWLLAADLAGLMSPDSPPEPTGVRLLPPQDPYLQQRDRETLLPETRHRRRLWRPVGAPGLVLVDGEAAGVWTAQVSRKALNLTVEPFVRLAATARKAVVAEAESIAPLRGGEHATVTFAD